MGVFPTKPALRLPAAALGPAAAVRGAQRQRAAGDEGRRGEGPLASPPNPPPRPRLLTTRSSWRWRRSGTGGWAGLGWARRGSAGAASGGAGSAAWPRPTPPRPAARAGRAAPRGPAGDGVRARGAAEALWRGSAERPGGLIPQGAELSAKPSRAVNGASASGQVAQRVLAERCASLKCHRAR